MADWRRRRRVWRRLAAAGVVLTLIYVAGLVAFAEELPRHAQLTGHPDAIVVLTGGGSRLDTAEDLLERGIGRRLLITGVNATTTRSEVKALVHGGPRFDCCVDLGRSATSTFGNAVEAAAWSRHHGFHELLVVTANYHMPRSLNEFHAVMPHMKLDPYPVDPVGIDLRNWWLHPRTIRVLQSEYDKYLASLVLTRVLNEQTRQLLDHNLIQIDTPAPPHWHVARHYP
ncbi:MAG: YdcF family protein [Alphaproteobacteria bacterium]|nr:YdcF family protein [Alphaproteobacteria bacterium]